MTPAMPAPVKPSLPTILVIFGVTGDLTRRKLVPALWHMFEEGMLPPLFTIVGFARSSLSREEFRAYISTMLPVVRSTAKKKKIQQFLQLFHYQTGQFEGADGYNSLASLLGKQDKAWRTCANKLFY